MRASGLLFSQIQLKKELDIISYKVKFIRYIFAKKIIVNNKPKKNIIQQLEKLKFPMFSLNENEESSYNYLLTMPIYSLSKEKIEELEKQKQMKFTEVDKLEKTSAEELWKKELQILLEAYTQWWELQLQEDEVQHENDSNDLSDLFLASFMISLQPHNYNNRFIKSFFSFNIF